MESDQIVAIVICILSILFVIYALVVHRKRRFSEEPKPRREPTSVDQAKTASKIGGVPVRDKICPHCNHVIPYFELKCAECGYWFDNDVFRKLSASDINLIKSRGLTVTTPSLIVVQNGGFIKLIGKELNDYLKNTRTNSTSTLVALYFLHAFAFAINLSVQKKSGREELLHQGLYETMIENYGSAASSVAPQLFECGLEEYKKVGVWLFGQLDSIWYGKGPLDLSPASLFMVSEKIGELILPDKDSIAMNMALFSRHVEIAREFSVKYSTSFMVEDDDYEWIKQLEI